MRLAEPIHIQTIRLKRPTKNRSNRHGEVTRKTQTHGSGAARRRLRENLHRRKQQSRAREAEASADTPPLPVTPDMNEKTDG